IERMALFSGRRFGEVAIELGILTEAQIEKSLADQSVWRIVRCLQREDHEWRLEEGQPPADVHGFKLPLEPIVLLATRMMPGPPPAEAPPAPRAPEAVIVSRPSAPPAAPAQAPKPKAAAKEAPKAAAKEAPKAAGKEAKNAKDAKAAAKDEKDTLKLSPQEAR